MSRYGNGSLQEWSFSLCLYSFCAARKATIWFSVTRQIGGITRLPPTSYSISAISPCFHGSSKVILAAQEICLQKKDTMLTYTPFPSWPTLAKDNLGKNVDIFHRKWRNSSPLFRFLWVVAAVGTRSLCEVRLQITKRETWYPVWLLQLQRLICYTPQIWRKNLSGTFDLVCSFSLWKFENCHFTATSDTCVFQIAAAIFFYVCWIASALVNQKSTRHHNILLSTMRHLVFELFPTIANQVNE